MRVVAVIVAYNRAALLQDCLTAVREQTRALDEVLVVDNASSDDSADVAMNHPLRPHVLSLTRNTGGAGGFAVGVDLAVRRYGADWVWLMDDDTIPSPTALTELLWACGNYDGRVDIAGSAVVWSDGQAHPMNTPRQRWRVSSVDLGKAAAVACLPVRTSSFVSLLVNADAVRRVGLPKAGYFIWNDDFEYSARVLRHGVGLAVPASVVEHRTKTPAAADADPGPRFYFEVRNKIWTLLKTYDFDPLDWAAYSFSTLRRWARTWQNSTDRPQLLKTGLRGLRDGLFTSPKPTSEVITEAMPRHRP